jgi:hypothetical protein
VSKDAVYGLYPNPESAQRAVDALEEAGVPERDIVIVSAEPFEDYPFGRRDHRTLMPWIAVLAGVLAGLMGFLFVAFTQRAYPLPTGGMPIVSPWPDGVITYELIMLGAILATLITLVVTARSPEGTAHLYATEVAQGKILVGAAKVRAENSAKIEAALRNAGAFSVVGSKPGA